MKQAPSGPKGGKGPSRGFGSMSGGNAFEEEDADLKLPSPASRRKKKPLMIQDFDHDEE